MFLCSGEVGADFLCREGVHLLLSFGRQFAPCGGVIWDEPLLYSLVEALTEHGVEATDGFGAQAQVLHAFIPFDSAFGLGFVVELLYVQSG